jgi:hypothetical protein
MSPVIDVRSEFRRIVTSKPVHAAAGAGVVASEALREFPARLARWRSGGSVAALEKRATGYVTEVRARAVHGYDELARRGQKVLASRPGTRSRGALNGKSGKAGK